MKLLRVYLSPGESPQFSVIIPESDFGDGETKSLLPFDGRDDRRVTLLKILESTRFHPKNFMRPGEQEWMVEQGILDSGREVFTPDARAKIGQVLYESLFPTESLVRTVLSKAIGRAETDQTLLHIQIQIAADAVQRAPISDYPWELIHDGTGFLAHRQITFSRYIAHDAAPPRLPVVECINVLLVSSGASDLQNGLYPLPLQERRAVRNGLRRAQEAGRIRLVELEPATFSQLQTYLTELRGQDAPQVFHFDGHGNFGRHCEERQASGALCHTFHSKAAVTHCTQCGAPLQSERQGYLVFEGYNGEPSYVSAQSLGSELQKAGLQGPGKAPGGIALAVLSACRSGRSLGGSTVFNGVAQSLIRHQVPAVVGMQYLVAVPESAAFAERFYQSLGQCDPLAFAVSRGRGAMGIEGDQWYRPVLYLRWKDNAGGQLFETQEGKFPDAGWLEEHAQIARAKFVEHMMDEDDQDKDDSVGRYLETLVRDRVLLMKTEPTPPFHISKASEHSGTRWLVFGDAGSGKTAALLKLTAEAAVRADLNTTQPIPVYVKLNRFKSDGSLDDILELCAGSLRIDVVVMQALWRDANRRILFLLDGYNEVGTAYREACSLALEELMEDRRHCYVITSRPGGEAEDLSKIIKVLRILEMAPLNEDQIRTFAEDHAPGLFNHMGSRLKELAANPSVLQLLVRACADHPEGKLPTNLGRLYQFFIDNHIFERREPGKIPAPTGFNYRRVKRPVLGKLAQQMTADSETRITLSDELEDDLVCWLQEAVEKNPRRKVVPSDDWTLDAFLSETIQNGVLHEVNGSLEFMHQSVQDYFTAMALGDIPLEGVLKCVPPAEWDLEDPAKNQKCTPYFDAICMLSGIQSDSSDLVRELLERDPILANACFRSRQQVNLETEQLMIQNVFQGLGAAEPDHQVRAMMCVTHGDLNYPEIVERLTAIIEGDGTDLTRPNAVLCLSRLLGAKALLPLFRIVMGKSSDKITAMIAARFLIHVCGCEDDVILNNVIFMCALGQDLKYIGAELRPDNPEASDVGRQALTFLEEGRSVEDLVEAVIKQPKKMQPALMLLRLSNRKVGIKEFMSIARNCDEEPRTRNDCIYATMILGYGNEVSQPLLEMLNDSTEDEGARSAAACALGVVIFQQELAWQLSSDPVYFPIDLRTELLEISADREQPPAIRAQAILSTVASGKEADLDDAINVIEDASNDKMLRGLVAMQLSNFLRNPLPAWLSQSSMTLQVREAMLGQGYGDPETERRMAKVQEALLRIIFVDDSKDIKSICYKGLKQIPNTEERLYQIACDEGKQDEVRKGAIMALGLMKTNSAMSRLLGTILYVESHRMRSFATFIMEDVTEEAAPMITSLFAALNNSSHALEHREHAAMGMLFMSSKEARQKVTDFLQSDEDRLARGAAAFATKEWIETSGDEARVLTQAERTNMRAIAYYAVECYDDQVIKMLSDAIDLNPEDPDLFACRAAIWSWKGEFSHALKDASQGLKIAPDRADLQENMGYAHWRLGQLEEALAAYQRAAALNPGESRLVGTVGRFSYFLRRYDDALQAYRNALEFDPDSVSNRIALIGVLLKLGRKEDAEKEMSNVAEAVDQDDAFTRAQFEVYRQNFDAALSLLESAVKAEDILLKELPLDPTFDAIKNDDRFKALLGQ